jgi:microcystin-dependent protein
MVSLTKPSQGTKDWHTPLNENFTKIEDELNAGDRLYGPFYAHEQSSPDMSVQVDAGFIWDGGSLTEVGVQNTSNISVPNSDDRIDRIVLDKDDGTISVVTGTEASSPSAPSIPSGKVPCCQIYLTPATSQIEDSDITDERQYHAGGTLEDLRENLQASAADIDDGLSIVGQIIMYGANDEPSGWLQCNGQAVSRSTYSDLWNKIGTTYGNGDGSTTFNVPDLRDRSPLGDGSMGSSGAGRVDNYSTSLGNSGGEDQHGLTISEMPAHNHGAFTDDENRAGAGTFGSFAADAKGNAAITSLDNDGTNHNHGINPQGGSEEHNNMHPFLVVAFLIKT